jgi:CheY-like chemotaxis protein/HPt (histidine-containing phosphotransfer) domain-containing protein
MPEIDGLELAEKIRSLPEGEKLPLVMLTALLISANELKSRSPIDFAAWLQKPLKKSQLYEVLLQIFWQQSNSETNSVPSWKKTFPEMVSRTYHSKDLKALTKKTNNLGILLAEDNSINQQVALLMLQKLGYRADVVGNGIEALRVLRQAPYDVVLMDVEMPEMDGLTATENIYREWEPSKRPWIIAVTAYAMQGDREKCLSAGMNDYITKPIREGELIQALQKVSHTEKLADESLTITPNNEVKIAEEESVLDLGVLKSIREMARGKAETILGKIIGNYLDTAPQQIQQIETAIASANPDSLRQAAHTLGSSSANLGAIKFAKLCKQLENLGRSGTVAGADLELVRLRTEYERVQVALELQVKGSP